MRPIVKVENISKQYRIGTRGASYQTLRDTIVEAARSPFKRLRNQTRARGDSIWALDGVSFDVCPGETVGIIGRNGAGKSTLLKILSRITDPTRGRAELYGRIGNLLEVGTGFHPELTGRENLYLSGAILGMKRAEIERKFDEIVAFSEIEKFIDTPVKHYSSGMYLRLAFSVAVHLDPEILIMDEVLAVGDAAFQLKCLNKMLDIRDEGRTILFVSHNVQALARLCKRAVYLSQGVLREDGPVGQVINTYLTSRLETTAERVWPDLSEAPGNDIVRLRASRVRADDGTIPSVLDIRGPVGLEMEFEVLQSGHIFTPNFQVFNEEGIFVFVTADPDPAWRRPCPAGRYVSTAWVPGNFLSEGVLIADATLTSTEPAAIHFNERGVITFQVVDTFAEGSVRGNYVGPIPGVVRPLLKWTTQFTPQAETAAPVRVGGSS